MTELLIKLFVRNSKNINNSKVRGAYGKLSGTIGIGANFLISLAKFVVGILYRSSSVLADAANNFTDSLSAVVTLIGFKLSGKPADKEHPYGHQRIEYVSALVVSFIIIFIGFELIKTSVTKIISPSPILTGTPLFVVLLISAMVKLWLYFFNRHIAEKISSSVIYATARDSLNDTVATFAVLLSAVVSPIVNFNLDGYAGCAVAVYIIYSGVCLAKDTVNPILGAPPSREIVDKITEIITMSEGVDGYHDLIVHAYGPDKNFSSVHIEIDAGVDLLCGHEISDNIERDVKRQTGIDLVVHIDPLVRDNETVNSTMAVLGEILTGIDSRLTFHDFRMVKGTSHTNLIFDLCVPYDFHLSNNELIDTVIHKLHLVNREFECIITVDNIWD